MKAKNIGNQLNVTASLLVLFGILVALNVVVAGLQIRGDMTEEKLYTLSKGTKKLLGDMERSVTLKFYFSRSVDAIPVPIKQFAQRAEELLREFETHSKDRVLVETYDPTPDSDEEEWAKRYGLQEQALGMIGGPSLFMGVVAVSGTREAVIPFLAPAQEGQLEYLVTRMIHEVSKTSKPRVGVMSSIPVMQGAPPQMPVQQSPTSPWVIISELQGLYDVERVDMAVEEVPENLDTLLVIQPAGLSDQTLFALDQFIMQGGRLFAFVDPLCISDPQSNNQPFGGGRGGDLSAFNRLLKAWGYQQDSESVVADLKYATNVRMANNNATRNVTWLSLQKEAIQNDEVATAGLESMLLPMAGSFNGKPTQGLEAIPLITTSPESGRVNVFQARFMNDGGVQTFQRGSEALSLALRLKGTFKSAFPEGPPTSPATEESDSQEDETQATSLTESEHAGVVILMGDVDFMQDQFSVQTVNIFGQTIRQPRNDNLNFVLNMVEQLTGSEALIGLRSRGTFNRPFTRVIELERQAQDRWRKEEAELQAQLRQTEERINQLQAQKDPTQQYILSPEQEREIKEFREKSFETQQALKEVRKNLRSDIEKLGFRLKMANMGLVPLVIGVLGIVRGIRKFRS